MKNQRLTIAVFKSVLVSAPVGLLISFPLISHGADSEYYRLAAGKKTGIVSLSSAGVLTWTNAAPTSFQVEWASNLKSNRWQPIVLGTTTGRVASVAVPLHPKVVGFSVKVPNNGIWLARSDGSWKSKIKDGGASVRYMAGDSSEHYVAYTYPTDIWLFSHTLVLHDLRNGTATNIATQTGGICQFDTRSPGAILYNAESPTGSYILRLVPGGSPPDILVPVADYKVIFFVQAPQGAPLITYETYAGQKRIVAYTYEGLVLRVLKDNHQSNYYNLAIDSGAENVVYTCRVPDYPGTKTAEVLSIASGTSRSVPRFLEIWPDSSSAHFVIWHPYVNLVSAVTNQIRSPIDGGPAGTYTTRADLVCRGMDGEGYWYAADTNVNTIVRLTPDP